MRAVLRRTYGSPDDVLEFAEVDRPDLVDDGVLVRVRAVGINRADCYGVSGKPLLARPAVGLRRPRSPSFGSDFAGVVDAVGKDVTDFSPGDEVFGCRTGAFAEYVCVRTGVT